MSTPQQQRVTKLLSALFDYDQKHISTFSGAVRRANELRYPASLDREMNLSNIRFILDKREPLLAAIPQASEQMLSYMEKDLLSTLQYIGYTTANQSDNPLEYLDPTGLAAILSRPINSGTKWYYNLANFIGTKFGIFHHWLVDRNGLDYVDKVAQYSGSESGITYSDKNSPIRTYTIKFSNLDDAITEKALKNVIASDQFGNGDKDKQKQLYKVFANDCKDFTTAVFNEYKSLWMQRDKENNTNNPEYNADASWDAHYKEITKQQGEKVDFSKAGE